MTRFNSWLVGNPITRAFGVLAPRERNRVIFVMGIQVALGILDLLGVALIGLLGALTISGVQSQLPGEKVSLVLNLLGLLDEPIQIQAGTIGAIASMILIFRTVVSIILIRRILFFLSRRGAALSSDLMKKLMSQSLLTIQQKTLQENLFSITGGVSNITLGILGTSVVLVADISLLIIMTVGLLAVDATMAMSTVVFFAFIGFGLNRFMSKKATQLGKQETELNVLSNEKITEVFMSYRETVVRNRGDFYAREIGSIRFKLANTLAELSFMPNVSKFVIETSVVIGALAISAAQFVLQDAGRAFATLAIFLAAGTRIAPAVLRVQQGSLQMRRSLGSANSTLDLIDSLKVVEPVLPSSDVIDRLHLGFIPEVRLQNVAFKYPGTNSYTLSILDLRIAPGSVVAIVGPSGAGKTTLVDLILGVLKPDVGVVKISEMNAVEVSKKWPGAMSYVPQDVMIANGTIKSNITLGFPSEAGSDQMVQEAIRISHLDSFLQGLPDGELSKVGDRGVGISGGQRQRLGIARALFTKPKLLVLDEATSALDGETEANISQAIRALKGEVTVLFIAHRLSTVRDADQVLYMENGRILATGTFEEVRSAVPNFDQQASQMGL